MEAAGLQEAGRLPWREGATPERLRRDGRLWTAWTGWVVALFSVPGVALLAIEPWAFPAAALCFAHAGAVPWLQARRGARAVVPIGGAREEGRERVALGLLGDLVGHEQREVLAASGLVVERGALGAWVVGEQGALLVRSRGRRVDSWCVRVGEAADLPRADRVAHLLLALREDEAGFAKVANLGFSGATWRVRPHLDAGGRRALGAAVALARGI